MTKLEPKKVHMELPPVFRAHALVKGPGGWVVVTVNLDNALKPLNAEVSKPDMKAISMEAYKILVGKDWIAQETGTKEPIGQTITVETGGVSV